MTKAIGRSAFYLSLSLQRTKENLVAHQPNLKHAVLQDLSIAWCLFV